MRQLVIKILLLSTFFSYLVKYGGRVLPMEATNLNALIVVITPTLVMGIVLLWRWQKIDS